MTPPPATIQLVDSQGAALRGTHRFAHHAMATTFEIIIHHADATYAQQAAWEAFRRLDQLEQELSRFMENSDISRINNLPAGQPLPLGLAAFECLHRCAQLSDETGGAFDITIGPLLDCWLNEDKTGRIPSDEELAQARQRTGTHLYQLQAAEHTVELLASPVHIDLGGFGKGYAVDQLAELLREWSIDAALIHGGSSSVLALGAPPGTGGWPLTLSHPANRQATLAHLDLRDRALSGSGLEQGPHIIDPRSGHPVEGVMAAWTSAPTAATADALSTAFMVMTPDEVAAYCQGHPDSMAMLVLDASIPGAAGDNIVRFGPWEELGRLTR